MPSLQSQYLPHMLNTKDIQKQKENNTGVELEKQYNEYQKVICKYGALMQMGNYDNAIKTHNIHT